MRIQGRPLGGWLRSSGRRRTGTKLVAVGDLGWHSGCSRPDPNFGFRGPLSGRQTDLVAASLVASLRGNGLTPIRNAILQGDGDQEIRASREELDRYVECWIVSAIRLWLIYNRFSDCWAWSQLNGSRDRPAIRRGKRVNVEPRRYLGVQPQQDRLAWGSRGGVARKSPLNRIQPAAKCRWGQWDEYRCDQRQRLACAYGHQCLDRCRS